MEKLTNLLIACAILFLMPAVGNDCLAQKKSKEKSKSSKGAEKASSSANISLPIDTPGAEWPEWFLTPPAVPHGVGVAPYWKWDPKKSYDEALDKAVEDLNSSDQLVVTVETAINNAFPFLQFHEFAINDRFNVSNVSRLDSVVVENLVYYLVAATPFEVPFGAKGRIPSAPEWVSMKEATANEEFISAMGEYKIFMYSKQNSWIKAKQDALTKLAQYVSLSVKTNEKLYNDSYSSTIYVKSRIYLQDILTASRWTDGTNYYIQLHAIKGKTKAIE